MEENKNKIGKKSFWSPFGKSKSPTIKVDREELKKRLTPIQYRVTQEAATERPFSGEYLKLKDNGMYSCVVCGTELFSSECKYESGCGWPAFYQSEDDNKLIFRPDLSHVGGNILLLAIKPDLVRTEVTCGHCGAHLGHIFDDGPKPTGKRYCINSAALKFKKSQSTSSISTQTEDSNVRSPQKDTSIRTRTLELDRNRRASHPNHHHRSSSTPRTLTSLRKIDRNQLDGVKVTPSPPDPREEERLKRSSAIFSDKLKFLTSPSKTSTTTTSESSSARKFLLMTTEGNRHPLPNNARAKSEEIDSRSIYRRLGHEDLLAEDHRHYHLRKLQQLQQQHQQQQHDEQQSNQAKVRIIPIRIEDGEEAKPRSPPQTNDNGKHTRILEIHHQQQTPSPSTFI